MRGLSSLLVLVSVLFTASVTAQETQSRAGEMARKQEEKAAALVPYTPNRLEEQLLAIEEAGGFAAARGWYATFGDIKSGSGIAAGAGYARTLKSGTVWYAKGVYSVRNFKLAQFGIQGPPLAGGRLWLNGRVRWHDAPVLRVYALGPDSADARADYAETMTEVSGEGVFRPVRFLRLRGGTGFESFKTGPGDSDRPPIETLFGTLPGLYADPDYLHTFASAALDSRDGESYSRRGSLLSAAVHDYRQQDAGPYSFQRFDAAGEQYVPILHGNWVLFFGARASTTSVSDGHEVPFFLMPALGGSRSLRGYHTYRFRDRHSLNVTGEYRWYAHEYVDVALFYDAGKVASARGDLNFKNLTQDGGIGIRFHGPASTVLRVDLARGDEGYHLVLAFSAPSR